MTIPQVIIIAVVASVMILLVFFHRRFIEAFFKIKDSFDDFILSLKYGNFTEREETVCDIYLNYHYPVYSHFRSFCWNCEKEVTSENSPRCPVCGIYICLNCGACHPKCTNRDEKILVSEKEIRALLKGKKKKAMQRRIDKVKEKSNDKIYYCAPVEAEFGAINPENK